MACHARLHPTVCAAQGPWKHALFKVVQLYVLSKVDDEMRRSMSSDRIRSTRTIMACLTFRRPIVSAFQGADGISTTDVVRLCLLQKGDDGIAMSKVVCPCM